MTHAQVTPPTAGELVRMFSQFPEVAGLPVTLLGSGTDHHAFDVGGRFVFRVPRSAEAAARAETERRLTSLVAPRVHQPVPVFRFVAEPSDAFPFGSSGYERLPGRPGLGVELDPARRRSIAETLGRFLCVLHSTEASDAGVPPDDDPTLEAWSAQALEDVAAAEGAGVLDPVRSLSLGTYLRVPPVGKDRPGESYEPCLVHGDFAAEHVLLDDDATVTGIIDWSDAIIGDPALDLAGLVHWGGEAMLAEALSTYGACDAGTLARARWFAACRAVADIVFGLDEGRSEYIAGGLRALAHVAP